MSEPNRTPERDPRRDPIEGDIIRHGETYGGHFHEVLERDPRLMSSDVSSICDGEENSWSLSQWRKWAATAQVIKLGPAPGQEQE